MKRLAWFSPLPISKDGGASTGAYWSKELLPILRREFEIEVFYDGFGQYEDFMTAHFLAAAKRHAELPFDLLLYQFEDKRCADFVRMQLGLIPGIVVFHDLLLTTDGPEPILNSSWTETVARFDGQSNAWPDRRAEYKRERPLAVREIGLAQSSVFSCPRLNSEFKREIALRPHIGAANSYYLPHPVNPSVEGAWGSATGRTVALCGGPQIEFRAHKIFQALSRIEDAEFLWLVSAAEESAAKDLAREFPSIRGEVRTGRSPQRWLETVAEADIAIHTHFSVYGQLGPYLQISQMAGLPCVALDFGGAEFISDRVLFKIQPGEREVPELRATVDRLFSDRATDWGAPGRAAALEECSTEKVAGELIEILLGEEPLLKRILARWADLERTARATAISDSAPARDPLAEPLSEKEREIFDELGWRA